MNNNSNFTTFALKQAGGTITCPPTMTFKMVTTVITHRSKTDMIHPFNFLGSTLKHVSSQILLDAGSLYNSREGVKGEDARSPKNQKKKKKAKSFNVSFTEILTGY